jgi:hypothetical protein
MRGSPGCPSWTCRSQFSIKSTGIHERATYRFGVEASPGALYNQVINGHHYLTQEEFSNRDFLKTGNGCLPSE